MVVGRMASKRARTLSFFFTLFGALEFAGEKIIHDQSGDKRGNAKILLWVVVMHVKPEVVAAVDQSREKFVYPVLLLVSPQAHGIRVTGDAVDGDKSWLLNRRGALKSCRRSTS